MPGIRRITGGYDNNGNNGWGDIIIEYDCIVIRTYIIETLRNAYPPNSFIVFFLFPCVSISLSLYICLSLYIIHTKHLIISPSIYSSMKASIYSSIYPPIHLSIHIAEFVNVQQN